MPSFALVGEPTFSLSCSSRARFDASFLLTLGPGGSPLTDDHAIAPGAFGGVEHANFIVNLGGASARDIESLIEKVREEVKKQQGVDLEPEVRIVGEVVDE